MFVLVEEAQGIIDKYETEYDEELAKGGHKVEELTNNGFNLIESVPKYLSILQLGSEAEIRKIRKRLRTKVLALGHEAEEIRTNSISDVEDFRYKQIEKEIDREQFDANRLINNLEHMQLLVSDECYRYVDVNGVFRIGNDGSMYFLEQKSEQKELSHEIMNTIS